jgi:ribosomal protein S18 acetylase RimI-like enzyme
LLFESIVPPIPKAAYDLLYLVTDASGTPMDRETFLVAFERHYDPDLDTIVQAHTRGRRPRLAGIVRYGLWPRPGDREMPEGESAPAPHIFDVVVDPKMRRLGVGRSLLLHAVAKLRDDGNALVHSRTAVHNHGAVALHRAVGFTVRWEDQGFYVWELKL